MCVTAAPQSHRQLLNQAAPDLIFLYFSISTFSYFHTSIYSCFPSLTADCSTRLQVIQDFHSTRFYYNFYIKTLSKLGPARFVNHDFETESITQELSSLRFRDDGKGPLTNHIAMKYIDMLLQIVGRPYSCVKLTKSNIYHTHSLTLIVDRQVIGMQENHHHIIHLHQICYPHHYPHHHHNHQ